MRELEDENHRLRMENKFPENAAAFFRPDAAVAERCALIEAEKANCPVAWVCRLLAVPRSSFYAWRARAFVLADHGLSHQQLSGHAGAVDRAQPPHTVAHSCSGSWRCS